MKKIFKYCPQKMSSAFRTVIFVLVSITGSGFLQVAGANASSATAPGPETRRLVLERIEVSGNSRFSTKMIVASLSMTPGEPLDARTLESKRIALLEKMPGLADAEFYTTPGSGRGLVVLHVDVIENDVLCFETGYGYHERYGWFLTLLGLRMENPGNSNVDFRLGLKLGFHVTGLDAELNRRPEGRSGPGYGLKLYAYNEERIFYDYSENPDYIPLPPGGTAESQEIFSEHSHKIDRAGVEMSFDYADGPALFSFGFNAEKIRPDSVLTVEELGEFTGTAYFPDETAEGIEKNLVTGLFFRMIRDTRDNLFYPRTGSYAYLRFQANNTILGGNRSFTKARLRMVRHFDLGSYRTIATRVEGGIVSENAPFHERFSTGGIYSIRGYREHSLSPAAGDNGFWIFSQELRVPLISAIDGPPRLSGLVFFDAGQGWLTGESLRGEDIKASAGYGVRLRLPWLGTLGIDTGIPLSESPTGDNFYIHGSLGFSF